MSESYDAYDIEHRSLYDHRMERHVLGGLVSHEQMRAPIRNLLTEDDFHDPGHVEWWRLLFELSDRGMYVDAVTFPEAIARTGTAELFGGYEYIFTVLGAAPNAQALPHYAQRVLELSTQRKVVSVAHDVIERTYRARDNHDITTVLRDAIVALGALQPRLPRAER